MLYSEWLFCWNPSKTSIIAHVPLLSDFWCYWCQKKCATLILPLSFLVTHTYLYLCESNERMKHIRSNYLNFSFSITFFMILDFILSSSWNSTKWLGVSCPQRSAPSLLSSRWGSLLLSLAVRSLAFGILPVSWEN